MTRLIDADKLPKHRNFEGCGNGRYKKVELVYMSDIVRS